MEAITPTKQAENLELAESTIQTFRASTKTLVADANHESRKHDNNDDAASETLTKRLFAPWVDSEGYTRRLQTFNNAQSYFAKPLKLSPLVCARFGWENTGTDLLTCACSTKCKGVIFVNFHPDLSPESESELVNLYRKMLATSHCDGCPFQMDSKRWLMLMDNHDRSNHEFVVPPYLIPMSKEFQVLEDDSQTGFVTKEHIKLEASRLEGAIAGRCIQLEHVSAASETVQNQIQKYFDKAEKGEICMLDLLKVGDEQTHDDKAVNVTKESALITLFGWRLFQEDRDNDSHPTTNQTRESCGKIRMMCKFCHTECFIEASDTNTCDHRGTKRPRLAASPALFDMMNCHRHFCPIFSGFVPKDEDETYTSGTSRPCWEVTLESLCRGYANQNDRIGKLKSGMETLENVDDNVINGTNYNGEKTYQDIRTMINASFLRK